MSRNQATAREALRLEVLGPVRVWQGDRQLPLGSPLQRALLTALLLRRGEAVPVANLIDALWGDDPPAQALAVLRTYASRLRKSFGASSSVLQSQFGGYSLRLGPEQKLDLDELAKLTTAAETASAGGSLPHAYELYGQALSLWDGEALAGVPGPEAEVQRARLAEQHLSLREQRLDVGLQIGLHAESVSELTALTATYPLRERLRELLMLALYRGGRQAEALAVYADVRRLLIDELGVEPRAELSEMQRRILEADGTLSVLPPAPPPSPLISVRPAQLPADILDFTGRTDQVNELEAWLTTASRGGMAVAAVAGMGGVGKSALAIRVAHSVREYFPDGQLYADLRSTGGGPHDFGGVLASFLRALGVANTAIPDGVDERAGLYRSLLDGRRVLTLLDNVRDATQVRDLLPGTPGCAALVTSRLRMGDLAGAYLVDLHPMSPTEAVSLLTRIVGEERIRSEQEAAMTVVRACGFLPLATRIVAARLAARRTWTVATVVRKLSDERRRLDELKVGNQAIKATLELGYAQLESEQARTFRLLGLVEGPDISVQAAAALLDRDQESTEDLLESLVDASFLDSSAPGWYRLHDLLRLFARACADRDEQPISLQDEARSRLLDYFLASAAAAYRILRPGDRLPDHLAPVDFSAQRFNTAQAAVEWLFDEAESLLASVRAARFGTASSIRRAVDILLAAPEIGESRAYSLQYEQIARELLGAAREEATPSVRARLHLLLSHAHATTGRFDEGDDEVRDALRCGTEAEDPLTVSRGLNELGIISIYRGNLDDAESFFSKAAALFHADDDWPGEASVLANLARVHLDRDRIEAAVELATSSVAAFAATGSTQLGSARYTLGLALEKAGRSTEALDELMQSLAIFHNYRQQLWEGVTHYRIAGIHLAQNRAAEAATHAELALELGGIGGAWRRGTVLVTLGRALDALGRGNRARACWMEALEIFEKYDPPSAEETRGLLAQTTMH